MPLASRIPIHITFLTLSPAVKCEDLKAAPPQLTIPILSEIDLYIHRKLDTSAQGGKMTTHQQLGHLSDFTKIKSIWYGPTEQVRMDEYRQRPGAGAIPKDEKPGEVRWAQEITVVDSFRLGQGGTAGLGPSVFPQDTLGLIEAKVRTHLIGSSLPSFR